MLMVSFIMSAVVKCLQWGLSLRPVSVLDSVDVTKSAPLTSLGTSSEYSVYNNNSEYNNASYRLKEIRQKRVESSWDEPKWDGGNGTYEWWIMNVSGNVPNSMTGKIHLNPADVKNCNEESDKFLGSLGNFTKRSHEVSSHYFLNFKLLCFYTFQVKTEKSKSGRGLRVDWHLY